MGERAETIVEIMPSVPNRRWIAFVESLRLNKRLEFNQGDIGVQGGIQMREAANINPTTVDMIRRFGGSTSPEIQWPEDDIDGEGDDRFERMEKLIMRPCSALQRTLVGHAAAGVALAPAQVPAQVQALVVQVLTLPHLKMMKHRYGTSDATAA